MSFPNAVILREPAQWSDVIVAETSSLVRIDNGYHRRIEGNYDRAEYECQRKGA
jgi:hypothetical protein